MNKKQVWIDTDLSVGMERHKDTGYCDVDDGFAIYQLMRADNVELVGMSAVFGNTPIQNAFPLCQQMNDTFFDSKLKVVKGASEKIDLTNVETNDAVEAMAQALKSKELIIMAIGPATNVGILLLKYPELASQIIEVVLVAGRRTEKDHFSIGTQGRRAPDLNFDLDNDAFRIMFEHKITVVLCPFEISNKVWITGNDLEQLRENENEGAKWLGEQSVPWLNQWLAYGAHGFNPFDVLASHYIIAPQDIVSEDLNAHLEIHLDDRVADNEKQVYKNYLLCNKSVGAPVKYCFDVVEGYHDKLMKTLLK